MRTKDKSWQYNAPVATKVLKAVLVTLLFMSCGNEAVDNADLPETASQNLPQLWDIIRLNEPNKVLFRVHGIKPSSEGMIPFRRDGYWGYLNTSGHEMIPPVYLQAHSFYNGYARVQDTNHRYGIIDFQGAYVMGPAPWDLGNPANGLVRTVDHKGLHGFRPLAKGHPGFGSFDEAQDYRGSRAVVRRDGMWYLIDLKGNIVSPGFDQIVQPTDTTAPIPVRSDGYWEYFLPRLSSITTGRFDKLYQFTEDYGIAYKSDSSYLINRSGNITKTYPGIWQYLGLNWIAQIKENKVHVMTIDGQKLSGTYEDIHPFKAGYAITKVSQGWTLLDSTGALFPGDLYPMLLEGRAKYVRMVNQGGMGLINVLGEVVLPPVFSDIKFLDSTLVAVKSI